MAVWTYNEADITYNEVGLTYNGGAPTPAAVVTGPLFGPSDKQRVITWLKKRLRRERPDEWTDEEMEDAALAIIAISSSEDA